MSEAFAKLELQVLKDHPSFMESYELIVKEMRRSGLLHFLRSVARCYIYDGGSNPSRSAAEAQYNAGYHACLDDIMHFKDLYLTESAQNRKPTMDFGGRRIALAKGDLLEGDLKR